MTTTYAPTTYEFDLATQTQIVACMAFDDDFLRQTDGLIKPDYFTDDLERFFVEVSLNHYTKYQESPSLVAWVEGIKDGLKSKRLREDQKDPAREKIKELKALKITSREWLLDKIAEFAKQQAVATAMVKSVPLLQKGGDPERFVKAEKLLSDAFKIGIHTQDEDYDYWEKIEERTAERRNIMAGGGKRGITTGVKELDDHLYHGGWGRKELSALIGGAKASKSFHLAFFAAKANEAGHNVLFVSLENSVAITSSRIDAFFSGVSLKEEFKTPHAIESGVKDAAAKKHGQLRIRRRPAGTFTPKDLRRLIDEYKAKGLTFDLIVIDYTDIMAPNQWTTDNIANSKSVLVDVRQIADDEDLAILTVFQTNREGHKSAVVRAEHAAEDFNKIRIADIVIAINRTDDEKAEGKARLTFAAARNQADGITLFVKQDLDKGRAIAEVESVE